MIRFLKLRSKFLICVSISFFWIGFLGWLFVGAPGSYNEAVFYYRLSKSLESNPALLNFSDLMPGEWELVCGRHGYDAPLYLKKYNRTYPTIGNLHGPAWGIIFISPDGSYVSAKSGLGVADVHLFVKGCFSRDESVLTSQCVYNCAWPEYSLEN